MLQTSDNNKTQINFTIHQQAKLRIYHEYSDTGEDDAFSDQDLPMIGCFQKYSNAPREGISQRTTYTTPAMLKHSSHLILLLD